MKSTRQNIKHLAIKATIPWSSKKRGISPLKKTPVLRRLWGLAIACDVFLFSCHFYLPETVQCLLVFAVSLQQWLPARWSTGIRCRCTELFCLYEAPSRSPPEAVSSLSLHLQQRSDVQKKTTDFRCEQTEKQHMEVNRVSAGMDLFIHPWGVVLISDNRCLFVSVRHTDRLDSVLESLWSLNLWAAAGGWRSSTSWVSLQTWQDGHWNNIPSYH